VRREEGGTIGTGPFGTGISAPLEALTLPALTQTGGLRDTTTAPTETEAVSTAAEADISATTTVTVTESAPAVTVVETQTTTVAQPSTEAAAESGVSPTVAAAVGAALAAGEDEEDSVGSEEWGWIAFGILAVAVAVGGIVWLVRRRSSRGNGGGEAMP
jgi:hypothetical protein